MKDNSKKNAYSRFFTRLLVLVLFVGVLDFTAGSILRYFYFKQQSGLLYRTTYALEKTAEDVLILGSSRANHHYIPEEFEKKLGLSSYNAGRDGQFIFYHYAVLQSVLKRYTPKMVILDFTSSDLRDDSRGYERLSSLYPYYKNHPELRGVAELKGPFEKFKLWSSIYPYNSSIFTIAVGNAEFNKKRTEDIKGFVPLRKEWNRPLETDSLQEALKIDSLKLYYFESFIKDCAERKVKLYIVNSPTFRKFSFPDPYIALAKNIAATYQVPFWDYYQDPAFLKNEGKLFSDATHLNGKGAVFFSGVLINRIQAEKDVIGSNETK